MAITLLQDDHSNQSGWSSWSVSLNCPANATFLVVASASSAYGSPPGITWNGVGLTARISYGGACTIATLASPATGTHTLYIDTVGDRGSCWTALWFSGVSATMRTTGYNTNVSSWDVTGCQSGDYWIYSGYTYWSSSGPYVTATGYTHRDAYASGYGQASHVGGGTISGTSVSCSATNVAIPDCWNSWLVIKPSLVTSSGTGALTYAGSINRHLHRLLDGKRF